MLRLPTETQKTLLRAVYDSQKGGRWPMSVAVKASGTTQPDVYQKMKSLQRKCCIAGVEGARGLWRITHWGMFQCGLPVCEVRE